MTIDEIRKNAPDGATHYHDDNGRRVFYVKFEFGTALYWDSWLKQWLGFGMPYQLKPL